MVNKIIPIQLYLRSPYPYLWTRNYPFERRLAMKKILGCIAAIMILFSSLAYAGGDQVCGDKAAGPAGDTSQGTAQQNRAAAD